MSKNNLNVVVIGASAMAEFHMNGVLNYGEGVNLYGICDIHEEYLSKAKENVKFGDSVKLVTDYREYVNDPAVDAAVIVTPDQTHEEITNAFLYAGKDVLCEKPAARTYEEALTMQKVQHETGRVLNIGVCNRFHNGIRTLKKLIDDGMFGDIFHVYVSFRAFRSIPGLGGAFTTKAIAGGGALIDWGVHYIDLILYCLGDPKPLTASGEAFSKLGKDMKNYTYISMWAEDTKDENGIYDVDDSVVGIVRTEGPVVSFNGAWAQNIGEREMFIDFMGDKAGIRLQYCSDFQLWSVKNGMLTETKVSTKQTDMYENEINDFIRCIKTGDKNQQYIDYAVETSKILQKKEDT